LPYWLKFTLYLLSANVVVLTLAHLLTEYGAVVNAIFAVVAAIVVIILGRKVLNRERL
jgi:chromate transport protein ChrA